MSLNNPDNLFLSENLNNKILAKNSKFIITGASGWIGRALLEVLYSIFQEKLSQNVVAISHSEPVIVLRNGYKITTNNYECEFERDLEYILCHFAFLTKDKISAMSDDEYREKNQIIRDNVTNIINQTKPKAIFYASSGAVYAKSDSYGILKLEDEIYFQELANKTNAKIIIPRIFNIAGPYINKHNLYALSDFIMQLKSGKIVINAKLPVIRSYIHIVDLFKICFSWIFDDKNSEKFLIFDTVNHKEIELSDLAKMIVKLINPDVKIIRENYDPNLLANNYVGDIQTEEMLCKKYDVILTGYEQIILDTYKYLNEL